MTALLRALLLRNRYCAPVGPDGELPGGGSDDAEGAALGGEAGESSVATDEVGVVVAGEGGGEGEQGGEEESGELVISLGGEEGEADIDEEAIGEALKDDPTTNAAWAKLRKQKQEFKRLALAKEAEARDLRARLDAAQPAAAAIEVGAEPDPDNFDMFEAEGKAKFKTEWAAWNQRKSEAEKQVRERQEAQTKDQQRWQGRVADVDTAAKALKVKDQDEATSTFATTLSVVQQAIVLDGPEDANEAALLRYALGANPAAAKKLAAISNPLRYAFAAAKLLYKDLKMTQRKPSAPPPERRVNSNARAGASGDQLARLQAEADKTGDRTKVAKFMRERAKQAA